MIEGWQGSEYLILFEEDASELHRAYMFSERFHPYELVGLRSWDDFILQNADGALFTVPTVPMDAQYLEPFTLINRDLTHDSGRVGKIKWYLTPLVFGGDPNDPGNIKWITLDEHVEVVKWWNNKYRELSGRDDTGPAA